MPDQGKTDILMQFFLKENDSRAIIAECAAQKDKDDKFMDTFHPSPSADEYSDFFQVLKFDLGCSMKDSEASAKKPTAPGSHGKTDDKPKKKRGEFMSWRSVATKDLQNQSKQYPIQFEGGSFTRMIDAASPIMFQNCYYNVPFAKAILVKRVSIDELRFPMSFMRLTFEKVLVTSVNWDDGDVLTETVKFVCQHFKVDYRVQDNSGQLGEITSAEWDWADNAPKTK